MTDLATASAAGGLARRPGVDLSGREPQGPRERAEAYGLPHVDLRIERVEQTAAEAISLHVLNRARAIPYRIVDGRLKVAVVDPGNLPLMDELRLIAPLPVDLAVAALADVEFELKRLARSQELAERAAVMGDETPFITITEERDLEAADGISEAPPIPFRQLDRGAGGGGRRERHPLPAARRLPDRAHARRRDPAGRRADPEAPCKLGDRVKVLAKLDITEHRLPQDGRLTLRPRSTGRLLDIRVAVLPTVDGEGVIMRLLDKEERAPTLTDIGLSNEMQMALEEVIYRPSGAFFVTGPTGAGKSTTVYAALADLRQPGINIVTIEDPVEYRLDDIYQVQVNKKVGLTFPVGLRAVLRSDPDVVMLGEVRDLETAKIALEAALTGHMVMSTLHANDAPGAIARLNDMGIEPFVTATAVSAVLAQRLVRRLCEECKEPYEPSRVDLEFLGFDDDEIDGGVTLYRRRGCVRCAQGYRGRVGIHQLLLMNDDLQRLTASHVGHSELFAAALESGMRTLWQDGIAKAAAGVTTIDELNRVVRR
jgi:type IV pilus assembly protein PilB